ncbi:MAG: T9SS type A sorting domain-containing protein, partial [Paludibacter sp.]
PTTDIAGLTRTGNITLGAYQATYSVASGETQTISQPTTLASLTVAAGGKLTINSGIAASIGSLTLESDANGTATMLNSGTFTGTVNAKQYLGSARNWYVSSPVSNATSPANNIDYYYEYVEAGNNNSFGSQPGSSSLYWKGLANETTMEIGKGYIAKSNAGTTVQFSGTPNNGNITTTFDLTRNDAMGKGFNLVGNPYPSYIDWSLVANANPNLSTTFYFRSKNTNVTSTYTFVTYNGLLNTSVSSNGTANTNITRFIPPTQAFWVRVNNGTSATKMYFNNDMRAHRDDNGNLLKAPKVDNRTCLRLQLINGSEADETLICTEVNADNGFDKYDSPKMMNNSNVTPDLYTKAGAERLVINGLNAITDNMELPLGFSLNAAVSLKLKATEMSNFPIGTRIYLLDKTDNKQIDLTPETEYSFSTTTATTYNESRFSLLFKSLGETAGTTNTDRDMVSVFVNTQNEIVILANENSNYAIFNSVGQLIENGTLNTKRETRKAKFGAGVYIVKVNNQSTRVIIK